MKHCVLVFCVLLALVRKSSQANAEIDYNCNRPGVTPCHAETNLPAPKCDVVTGKCSGCPGTLSGFMCNMPSTACTNLVCLNGGLCRVATAGHKCYCAEGYSGPLCATKRLLITCSASALTANLMMHALNFTGKIYVEGHAATSGCVFTKAATALNTMTLTLPYPTATANPCGVTNTTVGTDKMHKVKVYVQYSPKFKTALDKLMEISCKIATTGSIVSGESSAATINDLPLIPDTIESTSETGTSIQLYDSGTTTIASTKKVGDLIDLKFMLALGSTFKDLYVKEVTASDMNTAAAATTLKLVDGGCAMREASAVVQEFKKVPATATVGAHVVLKIKAFKFQATNLVKFLTKIEVCSSATPGTTNCKPATCTNAALHITGNAAAIQVGVGRRRRSAEQQFRRIVKRQTSAGPPVSLNTTMYVIDTTPQTQQTPSQSVPTAPATPAPPCSGPSAPGPSCLQQMAFIIPLIILAFLLLVAVAAAVFFFYKSEGNGKAHEVY